MQHQIIFISCPNILVCATSYRQSGSRRIRARARRGCGWLRGPRGSAGRGCGLWSCGAPLSAHRNTHFSRRKPRAEGQPRPADLVQREREAYNCLTRPRMRFTKATSARTFKAFLRHLELKRISIADFAELNTQPFTFLSILLTNCNSKRRYNKSTLL